jgi:hypothetical protein
MTPEAPPIPRRHRALALGLVLALALAIPGTAARADEALPADWVAVAAGHVLTHRALGAAVVRRMSQDLLEAGGASLTILRQMIQERVERQEARLLGLDVSAAEVQAEYDRIDREVKTRTNGLKNLAEEIQNQGTTMREFRAALRQQMLRTKIAAHPKYLGATLPKDEEIRIAQVEIVMNKLLERARVVYGVRTGISPEPATLEPGVVCLVNDEPITAGEFGDQLLTRLPNDRIHGILVQMCKAVLTKDVALTVEAMGPVIEQERQRWHEQRELATQEALRHLSFEDWMKFRYGLDLDTLREDPYFRGVYGLLTRFRGAVTEEEIAKDFEQNRGTLYGESILIHDVQIAFSSANALVPGAAGRDYKTALRMASDVLARHAAGVPWDQIAREINERSMGGQPDPTFQARRIRVRNSGNESLLFAQAREMPDGGVSRPFDTLSEVHVFQRIEGFPPLGLDQARELIRERLANHKANDWFDAQMKDETVVRIRWPLPE